MTSSEHKEWEQYIDELWEELREIENIREDSEAHIVLQELMDNLLSYQDEVIATHPPAKGTH